MMWQQTSAQNYCQWPDPPIDVALTAVRRALASFHPNSVPRLARRHYRRELLAWVFLPVLMGAVEGGVVAVVAKNAFAGSFLRIASRTDEENADLLKALHGMTGF